ncbi:MAG: M1 family metallopeptidase [Bacteroidetes bacterium]|nr:M1 family metallopeptidase [Bacteroidota bacterium]
MKSALVFLTATVLFGSCQSGTATNSEKITNTDTNSVRDTQTLSNADSIDFKHLHLDVSVSFERKEISGQAVWAISNRGAAKDLRLDSYALSVDSVYVDGKKGSFSFGPSVPYLGQQLRIPILPATKEVSVYYASSDSATALQWLSPTQTLTKKHPFLYTQSESVYARSWVPCPDGPGIRFTYDARVTVPKGLMALMSAENPQKVSDSGIYHFRMENPIPAYLLALAVGDIQFRAIDSRTGVYAEPAMIDRARWELADVGKMVTTAEGLYGPYRWGRYDVLILPPGFPIGGMENPRLTFATPTIIAGDRSLVNLIAHELAHNWSGNLVTNATWNDIWMNEGFTVYFERRITEAMLGRTYVDMLWELGFQDLEEQVTELGKDSRDTWLKGAVDGRDPDLSLSDIPYEKGSLFLELIEQAVGREKFDPFLKEYFAAHAFKSITTEQFLDYLNQHLIKGDSTLASKIRINEWVYGPGIPSNAPRADSVRFVKVNAARAEFLAGATPASLATTEWTTNEWLQFLRKMPKELTVAQMAMLDKQFQFTQSGNSEIADLWFIMAVNRHYSVAYPAMEKFLSSVGRQKFLEPLYGAMMASGQQRLAAEIYSKYRQNYHPLTQVKLDKLVRK